ncbi:MAG: RidA family protein [Pararhodobacter sp.]
MQAALDNVETVLREAGMTLGNIVRMNTYVTDMAAFLDKAAEPMSLRLARHDISPPGVLARVVELGRKDLMVEIEAIAAG